MASSAALPKFLKAEELDRFQRAGELRRRYGVGEGLDQLEWVVELLTKWPLTRLGKVLA